MARADFFLPETCRKESTQVTHPQTPGQIANLNGTQIYFEQREVGESVLLLHGFSGSSHDWKGSVAEWSLQFRRSVPDLRGHGPVIGERWPEFLKTAAAFLDE